MNSDYKLFSCLHPRRVINKYTHESITVGCGVCSACLTRRANIMSMQCSVEESDFNYCAFVSLTYSNEFVPLMRAEKRTTVFTYYDEFRNKHTVEDGFIYDFYDVTDRFQEKENIFGQFLFSHNISEFHLNELRKKVACKSSDFNGDIPYLSKYDVQCFMKRFRQLLKYYSNEKIRCYIVGEYGPVHFRPHFHLLLFFNSKEVFQNYRKCVRLAWSKRTRMYDKRRKKFYYKSVPFGRVDASISRGHCSSYVAKYVNSRTSLPRLYSYSSVRPFSSHSIHFAQSFYQDKKKEIYENGPEYFVSLSRKLGSRVSELHPWRSLTALLFPKAKRFSSQSFDELSYSYRLVQKARCFYTFDSIRSLTINVLNDVIIKSFDCNTLLDYCKNCKSSKDYFLAFVCYYADITCPQMLPYLSLDELEPIMSKIDHLFYISNHFLKFVCDNESSQEIYSKIHKIVDYYSYLDKVHLANQLSAQDYFINYNGIGILPYFYDNSLIDMDDISVYTSFRSYLDFLFESNYKLRESIKHKYLNDLNQIYINY